MKNSLDNAFQSMVAYHEASKHFVYRSAASPAYMDWENQPNPFRFYEGTEQTRLPLIETDG
ncbi:MAG: SagB/ThcOx family dehydrogenase, partial [bacterium]|nr:SagB/ThcOx family dehydrogenase [bacterium]